MIHILDNPAWNALLTGNRDLGFLHKAAAYFKPDISPFVALAEPSEAYLAELYDILPFENEVVLVSNRQMEIAARWKLIASVRGFQMLYEGPAFDISAKTKLSDLTEAHIPDMRSLTQLTNPGPFLQRTIEFGHYQGIFEEQQLIAMAGQRMHPSGFAEISAVCTHPAHLGNGYAKTLVQHQVNRILEVNELPFLHVKADNERAIKVYEYLGFRIRTEIFFIVIQKVL
ncbi:GNAT family N-acetyltransferase [Dyadobacter crusticola]|uniref:GNAT family N-acetyltransferase n=1 Tax=Dyadobacter crusticola TaxID=292407 RepID=UPI0004E165DC|nr:GNAT family N-acetyltransferase [Dyadobacter crusticola]